MRSGTAGSSCGAAPRCALASPLGLRQHPNEYRPERPVLLAVDQQLGLDRRLTVRHGLPVPGGVMDCSTWSDRGREGREPVAHQHLGAAAALRAGLRRKERGQESSFFVLDQQS
jgi:hypothetical protein